MSDRQPRCPTGESAVGDQGAGFSEPLRFDVAGRIEHFLHAGSAARTLVADHDDIAGFDLATENALDSGILALEDPRRPLEFQNAGIDARRLHDAAIDGEIARQHGEPAVLREGMFGIANAAGGAVGIDLVEPALLAERHLGRHIAGRRLVESAYALA